MTRLETRNVLIPFSVFLVLLCVSVAGWQFARSTIEEQSLRRFELESSYLHEQIKSRFNTYAQVLRGGVGMYNGSEYVSREEWQFYVRELSLAEYFPGILGVGFSQWIGSADSLPDHERGIREEGFHDYQVHPRGERDHYTSIVYLEPFDKRNQRAFGYDMFSEETRREAMERARDTGRAALSGRVELVQNTPSTIQPGFLLYLPVYSTKNVPDSLERRRETLTGFVYSPFQARELMKGILQQGLSTISFQIYDQVSSAEKAMLYDGEQELEINRHGVPAQFSSSRTVDIAGRTWSIHYLSTPSFNTLKDFAFPWVLLATGFLLSILVSFVAWMLLSARSNVERKTTELRMQEDINSVLLENLAEGVVACGADLQFSIFNKSARDWHAGNLKDVPVDRWSEHFELFEKDGLTPVPQAHSPLARALAGESVRDEEFCIVARGKSPRFVLVSGGPLPDRDGQRTGAVISMRDITEQRAALKTVERQQDFLRDVIDSNPNLICAKDRTGRYVLANKAYSESIYGVSPQQLTQLSDQMDSVTGRKGFNGDGELLADIRVIDSGEKLTFEQKLCDVDGMERWFNVGMLPIRSTTDSHYIALTIASEITNVKVSQQRISRLNAELESRVVMRTQSLEKANAELEVAKQIAESASLAKSSFLAAMSHEIRTPMNGVVGMVEVLLNESLNKDQKNSLQTVLDSAISLLNIIDDVLDFSKIEAGHFELDNTELSLCALIENVVSATVPLARKSNVSVSLFIDPAIPRTVFSDSTRIRQILTNLIGNAVKFSAGQTDRRGRVEIRALVRQADPLIMQFDITDNGVGMAADTLQGIFESFVQAESSTTRRYGGSGLGLAICKRIVGMMDGEIRVKSQIGAGSTFTVELPLEVRCDKSDEALDQDIAGVVCVVLPAEEYSAVDFKVYLESAGATVHAASSFREAMGVSASGDEPVVFLHADAHLQVADVEHIRNTDLDTRHVLLTRCHRNCGVDIRRVPLPDELSVEGSLSAVTAVTVDCDGMRRKSLIEAVAVAVGRASPEYLQSSANDYLSPSAVPMSEEAALAAGRLILVAEDDPINRKVIRRQLSLLGYTAEFAENGQQALDRWRNRDYALVITDLHMPVMDGYTLTRFIRKEEKASRTPVLALTANALRGEARRAEEAGVDEYLTKPLQLQSLKDALGHFFHPTEVSQHRTSAGELTACQESPADPVVFDSSVLPALVGDDAQAITECLDEYLDSLADTGVSLVRAIRCNDMSAVSQIVHRMKSSSLSVGAMEMQLVCRNLEAVCQCEEGSFDEHDAQRLELAMDRADTIIRMSINSVPLEDDAHAMRRCSGKGH